MGTAAHAGPSRKYGVHPAVAAAVKARLDKGQMLAMSRSCTLGWFDVVGFNPEKKKADSARLIISCGDDERDFVFMGNTLRFTQCEAAENSGDVLHTVVEIVPCLTS